MTMHEFHQRVVVVTGASGNLGRAVAQAFARHGAHLALLDRDAAGCEALIADLSGQTSAQVFEVDLLDPASAEAAAVKEVRDRAVQVAITAAAEVIKDKMTAATGSQCQIIMAKLP